MTEIDLTGVVGIDFMPEDIKKQLPQDGSDVRINVNSPGGYVFDGFDIFNTLKQYPGKILAVVNGMAASAASYIIMAADKIGIYANSVIMYHRSWGISIGNSEELKKEAEFLDGLDSIMAKEYAKRTGRPADEILAEMTDTTWLLGADKIIEANFADEILDDSEPEKIEKSEAAALFEAARNKVSASEAIRNRAAAYIKSESKPVLREENNTKEADTMNLNEYLDKNPEARAEMDASIKARADESMKADRDRIFEILSLSGEKVPENIMAAIKDGSTVGDYAAKELKQQRENLANAKPQDLGGFKKPDTEPKQPEGQGKKNALDQAMDDMIAKKKGGK